MDDLNSDMDLQEDCVPIARKNERELRLGAGRHYGKVGFEDRFDSTYSSGYKSFDSLPSENLDSCLSESRLASEEDNLIPVTGIASLNLENETTESVDEGFVSSDKKVDVIKDGKSEEDDNKEHLKLILDIYQQDEDGDT